MKENISNSRGKHALQEAHALTTDEVIDQLQTDRNNGLSSDVARERLSEYGPNRLKPASHPSAIRILAAQFSNILVIILLAATCASIFLGEIIDAVVILIIVVLVASLGFTQEFRTARVLLALKKMQSLTADVVREGELVEISAEEIVPGDVIIVKAGDKVSADMRVIESFNLQVDESAMTGESTPVSKATSPLSANTAIADQSNMLFSGTSVINGKGLAITICTGMSTELGKIAKEVTASKQSSTTLERRMNEIGKRIGIIVLIVISVVVSVSLAEEYALIGSVSSDIAISILLFGVALAVAAIPEALPAIMVGSLAIGAHRMAQENALPRNLSAVETLGSTQIVCTDKTGTLTKGEMTVTEVSILGRIYNVEGAGYEPVGIITGRDHGTIPVGAMGDLARALILCNDAQLIKEEVGGRVQWTIKGDTTEGALIVLGEKLGVPQQKTRSLFPRTWEIPFSSETKRMTTIHSNGTDEEVAYMKGAPESILERCAYFLGENEIRAPLDRIEMERIRQVSESMAGRALRVLAVAMKSVKKGIRESEAIERDFVFLGMVGMIDPPRPEAIEAINRAKKVGMKSIMITGDHKETAIAIASEMGIFEPGDLVLTGEELTRKSEGEYNEIVERVTVYARVTPYDKLRIVEAWQKKDRIVAMTGDGVNDGPALKEADIGIAMGITGTEVAKDAADLILLDDNFATIMKAVKQGRWIQDNVKKYLAYLLSANLVEIAVLTIGVLATTLFLEKSTTEVLIPLLAVQVLYINLATDGLPALAVGIGPPDPDIMERQVQKKGEPSVFGPEVRRFITWTLAAEIPLLLFAYLSAIPEGIDEARTRLFLAFVFIELALALNSGSLRFAVNKVKPHKWLVLSVIWEAILILILLQIPQTKLALRLTNLTSADVLWVTFSAIFTYGYVEVLKHFTSMKSGNTLGENPHR